MCHIVLDLVLKFSREQRVDGELDGIDILTIGQVLRQTLQQLLREQVGLVVRDVETVHADAGLGQVRQHLHGVVLEQGDFAQLHAQVIFGLGIHQDLHAVLEGDLMALTALDVAHEFLTLLAANNHDTTGVGQSQLSIGIGKRQIGALGRFTRVLHLDVHGMRRAFALKGRLVILIIVDGFRFLLLFTRCHRARPQQDTLVHNGIEVDGIGLVDYRVVVDGQHAVAVAQVDGAFLIKDAALIALNDASPRCFHHLHLEHRRDEGN